MIEICGIKPMNKDIEARIPAIKIVYNHRSFWKNHNNVGLAYHFEISKLDLVIKDSI